jgi:uncharacterized protein
MLTIEEEVPSPCNEECVMNDDDICTGCFRSFIEVVKWPKVDNDTRRLYMKNIEERRKKYNENQG